MNTSYIRGAIWILIACFISALNDMIFKLSGQHLNGVQALFFRFLFSVLLLIPFVIANPKKFTTKHFYIHALRGGLFALGMLPWCYGLIKLPMPLMTTISFTTPLFVIIMASVFLRESVGWRRLAAAIIGFLGIIISAGATCCNINWFVGLALTATLLFAILDILNKRLLAVDEGIWPLMFFSALWTTIFTFPLAVYEWQTPTFTDLGLLAVLGVGANAFFWCVLKAANSCDISALQPLKYSEFIFSCIMSVIVFAQWPTLPILIGIAMIIPATLYLSHHELKLEKKKLVKSYG